MTKETKPVAQCFNCNRPETALPLVSLRYAGTQTWICSQCLPILIHHPDQVAHKLAKGGTLNGA
ncbi:MAG: hypothetical protein KJ077_32070 [Anaerolineae bacterium]|nr:hypothetical protein [Anaerolineae bacterium]